MDPLTAGAAAAGGLGLVSDIGSSIITNIGNRKAQKRAQQYNIENWNRQNLYNHPVQQMERLIKAGLNPNLVYGSSGSTAMGQSEQIPDVKPAPYEMKSPGENFSKYFQMKQTAAQTDNTRLLLIQIQKQTDLIEAQRIKTLQEAANLVPSGTKLNVEAKIAKELADVDLATKTISQNKQQKELDILTAQEQGIIKIAAQTLKNLEEQGRNISADTAKKIVEKQIQDHLLRDLPPGTKTTDAWIWRKVQAIYNEVIRLPEHYRKFREWNWPKKDYPKNRKGLIPRK